MKEEGEHIAEETFFIEIYFICFINRSPVVVEPVNLESFVI